MRNPSAPMLDTLSEMYRFIPWISAVTAISVVVARMMPSSVRKLRSLFLCNELKAMRVASQKEALGRNLRVWLTGLTKQTAAKASLFLTKNWPKHNGAIC